MLGGGAEIGARTLRVTHRFAHSPERVFDAWLDPAIAGKFLFATPDGEMVRVEIDIAPAADGGAELTLTQGAVLPEYTERSVHGWTMILAGLERAIA